MSDTPSVRFDQENWAATCRANGWETSRRLAEITIAEITELESALAFERANTAASEKARSKANLGEANALIFFGEATDRALAAEATIEQAKVEMRDRIAEQRFIWEGHEEARQVIDCFAVYADQSILANADTSALARHDAAAAARALEERDSAYWNGFREGKAVAEKRAKS